ncbi:hypothetical protein J3B01_002612 [Coemansia erecta]|nr:hypothetical protein J3B01_002612 [Coemansia erecta]
MGRGKYTTQEALEAQPEPTATCPVVRVLGPRGQNLHEVAVASSLVSPEINARLNADAQPWFTTLAQLPPRFRSVLWVRRGSYVLADLSDQLTDKIGGEIAMVLLAAQVKRLKQTGQWPSLYADKWAEISGHSSHAQPGSESDDQDAQGNPNRRVVDDESSDSEPDSDSDDILPRGNPNRRVIDDESSDASSD